MKSFRNIRLMEILCIAVDRHSKLAPHCSHLGGTEVGKRKLVSCLLMALGRNDLYLRKARKRVYKPQAVKSGSSYVCLSLGLVHLAAPGEVKLELT